MARMPQIHFKERLVIKMNGMNLNGINTLYRNPIIGNNKITVNGLEKLISAKKVTTSSSSKDIGKNQDPSLTISCVPEETNQNPFGITVQTNVDKDTFECSGKINTNADPNATTSRVDRYIADMGKEEQEQLAEEYLRKAQEIEEQFKNGEITQEERQDMQKDLQKMYKVEHTTEAFTSDGEEYCTNVAFIDEKARNTKHPDMVNKCIVVDLTGKREQIYGSFKNAENIIRPKHIGNNGQSKKQNTPIEEAVTDEGKQKLSAQLVKNLMKDYMYQSDKTMMEKQKERIDEKRETEKEQSQLQFFEAFA